MRLSKVNNNADQEEVKQFASWILGIGDGSPNADENGETKIQIP